jgi:sugar phosphate isomerase/epimerase
MNLLNSCRLICAGLVTFSLTALDGIAAEGSTNATNKGVRVGLQLYSLRDQFAKDVPGTLDKVRNFGFTKVELAGTYGMTPEKFRAELDARKLQAVAGHFPFKRFSTDAEGIAREAKILGMEYVGCAWIDHQQPFDEKECREAIAVFNQAGEAMAKHGLKFFYHIHGYEFQPHDKGTLFDLILAETNPKFVNFEMDMFWAVHGGQDPVKLYEANPSRWPLTHLKGMKDGTATGLFTGHSDVANCVPLGTGKIDYGPILKAAAKAGVKHHFIEDESPTVEQQIPVSLRYLESFK